MSSLLGLDSLFVRLDSIANDEAVMRGIEKGCLRVERQAKIDCPVDESFLMPSIHTELYPSELSGTVGTNVKYSVDVEFGNIQQRAQPFLYPALQSNSEDVLNDIAESIIQGMGR